MIVYVATVPTYYQIMAVATTEAAAIRAAGIKALEYLKQLNAESDGFDTVEKVIDYFAVYATQVQLDGPGEFVGN